MSDEIEAFKTQAKALKIEIRELHRELDEAKKKIDKINSASAEAYTRHAVEEIIARTVVGIREVNDMQNKSIDDLRLKLARLCNEKIIADVDVEEPKEVESAF